MDCFNRNKEGLEKQMNDNLNLSDISRERSLDKLDKISAHYREVVVLHQLYSPDAFYVSSRIAEVMGSKPGASAYDVNDYNKAMHSAENAAHHTVFIAHFCSTSDKQYRTTYCFKNSKGNDLWLNTCSFLIKPGMGYNAFIVTLLIDMEQPKSGSFLLDNMPADNELDGFRKKVEGLRNRERQALDLIGLGMSNEDGSARMDISRQTFKTYRKEILAKLGAPYNKELARYVIAGKIRSNTFIA